MNLNFDLDPLLLLPLALVLILMALPILSRRMKGKVNYTTTGELNTMLARDEPVVVIDVRSEKLFAEGHIEGAVNMTPSALKEKMTEGGQGLDDLKSQRVIIVCKSDMESIDAAKFLEAAGFENVSVMKGGIFRWKRDHLPMVKE